MKTWQAFMPDILPEVSDCPEPTIVHALRRASRQFFEQTRIWRLQLDPVTVTAGVVNYDLELETNSELVSLVGATFNGLAIEVVSPLSLLPNWRTRYSQYAPCVCTEDRSTFNFLPPNTTGDLVQVEVILKPSSGANGIEDVYFNQYAETIAMGAKARLYLQSQNPYSNPNLGALLDAQFNNAITDVNIRRAHGFGANALVVQPRQISPVTRRTTWF